MIKSLPTLGIAAVFGASAGLALAPRGPSAPGQTYTLVALETAPGSAGSAAWSVGNGSPLVVGGQVEVDGETHAFLWQLPGGVDLGAASGLVPLSAVLDVGQDGAAVGYWTNLGGDELGVSWAPDHSPSDVGHLLQCTPFDAPLLSRANGVNASGHVVGRSLTRWLDDPLEPCAARSHAFLRHDGEIEDLGSLAGPAGESEALAVSDAGQVVGWSRTASGERHAFVYAGGGLEDLGTLGGDESRAEDVNEAGDVVGEARLTSGERHAFLYTAGVMIDLGSLNGPAGESSAHAVNESGDVVGSSTFTGSGASRHAFLFQGGSLVDLNDLLPAGSGWELVSAEDINDAGDIVGVGVQGGVPRAFLLTSVPVSDLRVTLSGGPDPVAPGAEVTYTIVLENLGPGDAAPVTVTDTLPAFTSPVSCAATGGGVCGAPGPVQVVSFEILPAGASATITLVATVDPGAAQGTALVNQASAASPNLDAGPSPNSASATVTVSTPEADLGLAKAASPDTVLAGDEVTYTLTVTNAGPSAATSVTVTDTLPLATAPVSCIAGGGGVCGGSGNVQTVSFASLDPGASAEVLLTASVDDSVADGTILENTARVRSDAEPDPAPANNVSSASVTVENESAGLSDVALVGTASPDTVRVGGEITYTLVVSNLGPAAAPGVIVTDTLPGLTTFVSCAATGAGVCGGAANARTVTFSTIEPDRADTVTVVAKVNEDVPDGTAILNRARVDVAGLGDPDPTNDTAVMTTLARLRRDLVVILTDDQSLSQLAYMPRTNALLVDEGVRFRNAFVAFPLCCPSRASILTGLYAHNHGVLDNDPPFGSASRFDPSSTIATWLDDAGYRTGFFGKYLNGWVSLVTPPGWDDWHEGKGYYNATLVENGSSVILGSGPGDYLPTVLANKSVQFIESAPAGQPIFVYYAPFAPHGDGPNALPTPAVEDAADFDSLSLPRPPSYNEADMSDKPAWIRSRAPLSAAEEDFQERFYRRQVEALQSVDRGVEAIVGALEASGRLENAVIVFASDNGWTYGEHRHTAKNCPYEECTRIPLLVRAPGVVPREDDHLVLNVDFAATLVELAGVEPPAPLDGRSFAGLLQDPSASWRDTALIEVLGRSSSSVFERGNFQAVHTDRHFYAEYMNGDRELYDLLTDPYELANAASAPENAALVADLSARLRALKSEADLEVLVSAPDSIEPGGEVTYDVTVRNQGPETAASVRVVDSLPPELAFSSCAVLEGPGICEPGSGSVRGASFAALKAGAEARLRLVATVDPSTPGGASISNTLRAATLAAVELDPSDDWASVETEVVGSSADLGLTLSAAPDTVLQGSIVTYSLTVSNGGPQAAEDVIVLDSLPAGTSFVSCTATLGGACGGSGAARTVTFTSLAPGANAAITLVATVAETVPGGTVLVNPARVQATSPSDPFSGNDAASASVVVRQASPGGGFGSRADLWLRFEQLAGGGGHPDSSAAAHPALADSGGVSLVDSVFDATTSGAKAARFSQSTWIKLPLTQLGNLAAYRDSMTILFRVKRATSAKQFIAGRWTNGSSLRDFWGLQWNPQSESFQFRWLSGGAAQIQSSKARTSGLGWEFWAVTFAAHPDSTRLIFYRGLPGQTATRVDRTIKVSRGLPIDTTATSTKTPLTIGRMADAKLPFVGLLDELYVAPSAFSKARIDSIFRYGAGQTSASLSGAAGALAYAPPARASLEPSPDSRREDAASQAGEPPPVELALRRRASETVRGIAPGLARPGFPREAPFDDGSAGPGARPDLAFRGAYGPDRRVRHGTRRREGGGARRM